MIVGLLFLDMHIYTSNSLKEKRSVVNSIKNRISNRFNVSITELKSNEKLNSFDLALSTISNSRKQVDKVISDIINFIDKDSRVEILNINIELI